MDSIVTSHAKDLEELSHHLAKISDICECMVDKFLSKEMEYLTKVLCTLEQENQKLKESIEEWKYRYEEKEKELDEMKTIGYIKPRRDVEGINGDILWQEMLHSDSNAAKRKSQDLQVISKKAVSRDKGKAPMITPPNSNRKIITVTKSTKRDPKPPTYQRKRKIIPSSEDGDTSITPNSFQKGRQGPNKTSVKSSSSKNQDKNESKNVDIESEWDEIALNPKKAFGSSGKANSPISISSER